MSKNAKGDKGEAPVKAPAAEGISGTDVLPSDKEFIQLTGRIPNLLKAERHAMVFIAAKFKIPMREIKTGELITL